MEAGSLTVTSGEHAYHITRCNQIQAYEICSVAYPGPTEHAH